MSAYPPLVRRWPPKVGDRLRGIWGPDDDPDDPLIHVVSVFEHDDRKMIVTAEWFAERQRFGYEVRGIEAAIVGLIRPDGDPRVQR